MSSRLVVGQLKGADNAPLRSLAVYFYLAPGQYDVATQYGETLVETCTTYLGNIEVELWVSDIASQPTQYSCSLPDGSSFDFFIPTGTVPIDLSLLRLFGLSSMQSPQQSATLIQYVQDLVTNTIAATPQLSVINRLYTQPYPAGLTLPGLIAVTIDPVTGLMIPASVTVATHGLTTIGILPTAILAGTYGAAIASGVMQDVSWNWTPGLPIFLGINGVLTQNIPVTGFIKQMAIALTPTQIDVDILEPIYIL